MGDFFMSGTKEKKLNLPQSLLLLLLIIVSVAVCIRLKTGGPMIGLFASWIFIYLFCKIFGISYANIVAGAYDAIRMVVPTLCLLMAIGVMIGTWLQSGTIATIISWGLKMINPSWLLPLTLLFCSILSIVTGTSYGSVGSAGVAMMAIGNAMGIHPGMVAGAVICGAMFGDKLSPLSDTTNLAPAVADAKLGDHIRSMLWTTLPTYVITLILFTILGFQQTSGSYTEGSITVYINALNGEFQLGWITMIPAILIIVLLLCKVNAISALGLSSFAARICFLFCAARYSAGHHPHSLQRLHNHNRRTGITIYLKPRRHGKHAPVRSHYLLCCRHGRHAGKTRCTGSHSSGDCKENQQRWKYDPGNDDCRLRDQPHQLLPADGTRSDRPSDGTCLSRAQGCTGNSFPLPRRLRNYGWSYDSMAWLRRIHGRHTWCCMVGIFPVLIPALPDPGFQYFLWIYRNFH